MDTEEGESVHLNSSDHSSVSQLNLPAPNKTSPLERSRSSSISEPPTPPVGTLADKRPKMSLSTLHTSRGSANLLFDRTRVRLLALFSQASETIQTIPEAYSEGKLLDTSSLLDTPATDPDVAAFPNPFKEEEAESGNTITRFLNSAAPPQLPASPAPTNLSEESAQTIQYEGVHKEESLRPVSKTATYITPKLSDFLEHDSPQGSEAAKSSVLMDLQKPDALGSQSSFRNLKKSRSLKNLKKSLRQMTKISFKNSNDSQGSFASDDKSLTSFLPDVEGIAKTEVIVPHEPIEPELLEPKASKQEVISLQQVTLDITPVGSLFDIDFDKEVSALSHRKSGISPKSGITPIGRSRRGTVVLNAASQALNANSSFSAVSYAATRPVDEKSSTPKEKRRSTVYIRQSWLHDEALAICKDEGLSFILTADVPIAEEEDDAPIPPLNPNAMRSLREVHGDVLNNTAFSGLAVDLTKETADTSVEKDISFLESELEDASTYLFKSVARRRSEADLDNVALLEVQVERPLEELEPSGNSLPEPDLQLYSKESNEQSTPETQSQLESEFLEADSPQKSSEPDSAKALKRTSRNFANVKRLTLHTPSYLLSLQDMPSVPALPNPGFLGQQSPASAEHRLSMASLKNTIFLQTPTKKFGHGRSISVASSVYSNGASGVHSRLSSLYGNDLLLGSVDDLTTKSQAHGLPSPMGQSVVDSETLSHKKNISVNRNSYLQFNFNRFEDFKNSLDGLDE